MDAYHVKLYPVSRARCGIPKQMCTDRWIDGWVGIAGEQKVNFPIVIVIEHSPRFPTLADPQTGRYRRVGEHTSVIMIEPGGIEIRRSPGRRDLLDPMHNVKIVPAVVVHVD